MPGASLEPDDKLEIALALADAGVKSIDAGFPASSASEIEAVRRIAKGVRGPVIMALCRALERDIDAAIASFEGVSSYRCAAGLFLATSPIHREKKLRKSKEEILALVRRSVEYARRRFLMVMSHINTRSTTLTWSIRYAAKPRQNTALMSRNLLRNSKSDAGIGEQFIMSPPTQYLLIQIYDTA